MSRPGQSIVIRIGIGLLAAGLLLLAGCAKDHRLPTSASPDTRTSALPDGQNSAASGDASYPVSSPARGPWDGHGAAFTFSSDDGYADNMVWSPIFQARGWRYTAFVVSGWVGQPGKLTEANLKALNGLGFEIGSHSTTHKYLTSLDDRALTWELRTSKRDLETLIGKPYRCRTLAYPFHSHDDRVMEAAATWFEAARDGGTNPEGHPSFSEHYGNWGTLSLLEVPLTVTISYLTGDNANDERTTRERMRGVLVLALQKKMWVNTFAHKLSDVDAQHMGWLLDEIQANGDVWVGTFADIAAYYRTHFQPSLAPSPGPPEIPPPGGRGRKEGLPQ